MEDTQTTKWSSVIKSKCWCILYVLAPLEHRTTLLYVSAKCTDWLGVSVPCWYMIRENEPNSIQWEHTPMPTASLIFWHPRVASRLRISYVRFAPFSLRVPTHVSSRLARVVVAGRRGRLGWHPQAGNNVLISLPFLCTTQSRCQVSLGTCCFCCLFSLSLPLGAVSSVVTMLLVNLRATNRLNTRVFTRLSCQPRAGLSLCTRILTAAHSLCFGASYTVFVC
jgi:hypothetical protein